ncbi:MAG: hypothetical protein M1819_002500 [Sarea resinae]|nr:MAG: hypothetical protein M1819_002500 [Sarea resinae]
MAWQAHVEGHSRHIPTRLCQSDPLPSFYVCDDTPSLPPPQIMITDVSPSFATKVVNRWYHRRTLIIGDAAHVFPPFGGQGIAAGIRDAQALSWRLAFLSQLAVPCSVREKFLTGWAHERRQVCNHATKLTRANGSITNQRSAFLAFMHRILMGILWCVPAIVQNITRSTLGDTFRYEKCEGGFMLRERAGGSKLPQIWIQREGQVPELSDTVFISNMARLALVVVLRGDETADLADVEKSIEKAALPGGILTKESVTFLRLDSLEASLQDEKISQREYRPCSHKDLVAQGIQPITGYDEKTLERRIGIGAKYVIVRPDFYIHSVASDETGFSENVQEIGRYFGLAEE